MKTTIRFSFIALGAALAVVSFLPLGVHAQTAAAPVTTATDAEVNKTLPSLKIPTKLDEIAQLTKAGVDDPTILTYIKNSDTSYNLNAQEIISLRDQGVSPAVTAALIQRGAEVRQAAQEAAKEAAKESQAAVIAAAPTYQTPPVVETYAPAPVTYVAAPIRPASTVSVTYIGYPSYNYSQAYYPRYATYGSTYYSAPRVSFGIGFGGGHFGGGHFGGHRFGGYHSSARFCR